MSVTRRTRTLAVTCVHHRDGGAPSAPGVFPGSRDSCAALGGHRSPSRRSCEGAPRPRSADERAGSATIAPTRPAVTLEALLADGAPKVSPAWTGCALSRAGGVRDIEIHWISWGQGAPIAGYGGHRAPGAFPGYRLKEGVGRASIPVAKVVRRCARWLRGVPNDDLTLPRGTRPRVARREDCYSASPGDWSR